MKICILTNIYPKADQSYAGAFIHARAKLYKQKGIEVFVAVPSSDKKNEEYQFENISVIVGDPKVIIENIYIYSPDLIAVHAPYYKSKIQDIAISLSKDIPFLVWIHGAESLLTSKHYYHNNILKLILSVPRDILKFIKLRKFLQKSRGVVYVSEWMKFESERNLKFKHDNSYVIPNPIDTDLFKPNQTSSKDKKSNNLRGVAIRSLSNKKYGLDIAIKAFSKNTETDLTIYGVGRLENKFKKLIYKKSSNVILVTKTYNHSDIPSILNQYDYFVAPSRTEAQGVAMCEAMACGLPVVSTRVGGIPEFVRDGVDGYLVQVGSVDQLSKGIKKLTSDKERFEKMKINAREQVLKLCSSGIIVEKEIEVMLSSIQNNL